MPVSRERRFMSQPTERAGADCRPSIRTSKRPHCSRRRPRGRRAPRRAAPGRQARVGVQEQQHLAASPPRRRRSSGSRGRAAAASTRSARCRADALACRRGCRRRRRSPRAPPRAAAAAASSVAADAGGFVERRDDDGELRHGIGAVVPRYVNRARPRAAQRFASFSVQSYSRNTSAALPPAIVFCCAESSARSFAYRAKYCSRDAIANVFASKPR